MSKTNNILATLNELRKLTTGELREKYVLLFRESTTSRNKIWMFRKIAAALQEGATFESAAAGAPKEAPAEEPVTETGPRTERAPVGPDPRLPEPGTVLERVHGGKVVRATVLKGGVEYEGKWFRSLSAVAREATGTTWNGLLFFRLIPYAKRTKAA